MKILSILICSLDHRQSSLLKLLDVLNPQLTEEVELLIETDNGVQDIGSKRNILLERSVGKYICFIDDDDLVSNDYVSKILNAVQDEPDCVGIEGQISFSGKNIRKFIQSIKYDQWFEKNNVYYRCPNHLSPVKRELAITVMFPKISFQEDRVYSARLYPLLKTENYIEGCIYFYNFIVGKPDQKLKYKSLIKGSDIEPKIKDWGKF